METELDLMSREIKHGYPFTNICLRISIAECPYVDIPAWISMWISLLVWIVEDLHLKIMDIYVDSRRFLKIHVWICYGFLDQGVGLRASLYFRNDRSNYSTQLT